MLPLHAWLLAPLLSAAVLPPQVAGQFYPADPKALSAAVDGYLAGASTEPAAEPLALLVPHAGYEFSAKTAAAAFRLLRGRKIRRVIVLGTGHHVAIEGAATLAGGSLATPLGAVPVDEAAVRALIKLSPLFADRPDAFAGEHAVEVELPFLQRLLGRFELVPLLMNSDDPRTCRAVGEALAAYLKKNKALLVVSSDLSHYPPETLARLVDRASLAALVDEAGAPDLFWRTNRLLMRDAGDARLVCTECGEAGVLAAAWAMKALGAHPILLDYSNSASAPGADAGRVVGYGAAEWVAGPPPPRPALSPAQRRLLLGAARQALVDKLVKGRELHPLLAPDAELNLPAAVFVTLRRKDRPEAESLRGCIGGTEPDMRLIDAVRLRAVQSALEDPRFPPVAAEELDKLSIEISRLGEPRPVASYAEIKSGQGVTAERDGRFGIFLPQVWQELTDRKTFLEQLCAQKAGLPADCYKDPATRLSVFEAEPFEEPR